MSVETTEKIIKKETKTEQIIINFLFTNPENATKNGSIGTKNRGPIILPPPGFQYEEPKMKKYTVIAENKINSCLKFL